MVLPPPRERVQPALAVMQIPERHAVNDVRVLVKQPEQLREFRSLLLENLRRTAIAIRVQLREFIPVLAAVCPPTPARNHIDVQFRHHHFDTQFTHRHERGLEVRQRQPAQFVMPLQSNGVNRNVLCAQRANESYCFFALCRKFIIVIVVNQECVGVGLMRVLKCLGNELLAACLLPAGRTKEVRAIIQRFIDNIPGSNATAVASDDALDVLPHPLQQQFTARRLVTFAIKPRRGAIVLRPNETMPHHFELMPRRELNESIGLSEIELAFHRLNGNRLHAVLRRHRAELGREQWAVVGAIWNAITDPYAHLKQLTCHAAQGRLTLRIGKSRREASRKQYGPAEPTFAIHRRIMAQTASTATRKQHETIPSGMGQLMTVSSCFWISLPDTIFLGELPTIWLVVER